MYRVFLIHSKKKTILHLINENSKKCFQHVSAVALKHGKIGKHHEIIKKIRSFIEKNVIANLKKDNVAVALNVLHAKNPD